MVAIAECIVHSRILDSVNGLGSLERSSDTSRVLLIPIANR